MYYPFFKMYEKSLLAKGVADEETNKKYDELGLDF